MPHSLRVKLRGLERNNILKKREVDRIINALDCVEKGDNKYPYTGEEKNRPCPCGAKGEACMTCPWEGCK